MLAGKIWTLKQTEHEILYQVTQIHETTTTTIKSEPKSQITFTTKVNKTNRSTPAPSVHVKRELDNLMQIKSEDGCQYKAILHDYFQLDINLRKLYEQWKKADANFNQVATEFPGVRILRQDPTENLFAFICSSNNNISRITSMVEKLCLHYGEKVGSIDGEDWFAFPPVTALAKDGVEQHLRELGFGYRAKFINQTAKFISQKEDGWLESLRMASYEDAHAELLQLTGVGAKV